jgi:arylsulfatase A-like enzyme
MIAYMDKMCGRILAEVDRLGIAENTVVIFMGDNGTDLKSPRKTVAGEVHGGKTNLNDAGTHIPLIVRHAGKIEAGAVANDLIDMADLFPTICELASVSVPEKAAVDGVSFADRLHGGEPSARPWITGGIRGKVSLFDGSWRVETKSDRIIDARRLPQETVLETPPQDSAAEIERLQAAAQAISK